MEKLAQIPIPPEYAPFFQALSGVPIYYMKKCWKYNGTSSIIPAYRRKKRLLVITPDALYLCTPNGDINRCVAIHLITEILRCPNTNTFALKVPVEYDLLLESEDRDDVIRILRAITRNRTYGRVDIQVVKVPYTLSLDTAQQYAVNLIRPENYQMQLEGPPPEYTSPSPGMSPIEYVMSPRDKRGDPVYQFNVNVDMGGQTQYQNQQQTQQQQHQQHQQQGRRHVNPAAPSARHHQQRFESPPPPPPFSGDSQGSASRNENTECRTCVLLTQEIQTLQSQLVQCQQSVSVLNAKIEELQRQKKETDDAIMRAEELVNRNEGGGGQSTTASHGVVGSGTSSVRWTEILEAAKTLRAAMGPDGAGGNPVRSDQPELVL